VGIMKKLIWRGNYPYPDLDGRGYNDRLKLETRCIRFYPMPSSDKYSVEDPENMELYGLYEVETDVFFREEDLKEVLP
jgi:hypothetical protein